MEHEIQQHVLTVAHCTSKRTFPETLCNGYISCVNLNLVSAVADILRQHSGALALTPSATNQHATSAAVQRIRALLEDCAPSLDVTENQEENVKALVLIAFIFIAPATKYHTGGRSDGGFDPDDVDWSEFS
jgi:hypothetical protein